MESSQNQQSKLARKQEAKKLKRQRIIDAGGKRPREKHSTEEISTNNNDEEFRKSKLQKKDNHHNVNGNKKKKKNKNNQNTASNSNRFGRVMINTPCPNKPRTSTLSIAIPGSIVSNAQTMELRTYLIGQIARACTIYHVDEIIVFDDNLSQELKVRSGYHHRRRDNHGHNNSNKKDGDGNDDPAKEKDSKSMAPSKDPHTFMANILQYCECPQYLRRHFFPMHPDLQFAGLLNPLDAPHHVRVLDRCLFRDGVVSSKRGKGGNDGDNEEGGGSLVDCGIRGRMVEIDRVLTPGIRCTVQMDMKSYGTPGKKHLKGKVVSPSAPREHDGTYWGYSVRMASSIKSIFDEAPYESGYDLKIGTSERGDLSVDDELFKEKINNKIEQISSSSSFQHALIVLGGVAGIEECVDADETINISGNDSRSLFDLWLNICEYQGSRTIRTEEAVLIGLSRLCPFLFPFHHFGERSNHQSLTTSMPGGEPIAPVEFSDDEYSEEET